MDSLRAKDNTSTRVHLWLEKNKNKIARVIRLSANSLSVNYQINRHLARTRMTDIVKWASAIEAGSIESGNDGACRCEGSSGLPSLADFFKGANSSHLLGIVFGQSEVASPRGRSHTPSIAFRHLPPNSARFGYATKGALFISAQLSTDAVSAPRKVRVLIWR